MGCILVDWDSGRVVPGLIHFGGHTFKSTAFTTGIAGIAGKCSLLHSAVFLSQIS